MPAPTCDMFLRFAAGIHTSTKAIQKHIYESVHLYICTYLHALHKYVHFLHIYIHAGVCVCVCAYICIYSENMMHNTCAYLYCHILKQSKIDRAYPNNAHPGPRIFAVSGAGACLGCPAQVEQRGHGTATAAGRAASVTRFTDALAPRSGFTHAALVFRCGVRASCAFGREFQEKPDVRS